MTNLLRSIIPSEEDEKTYKGSEGEGYLEAFSAETKQFIKTQIQNGEKNIYHSVMAMLDGKPNAKQLEIREYYFQK